MAGARRLAGLLAAHWNNPAYADAEALVLLHPSGTGSDGGPTAAAAAVAARLPVHRLVLTAASPYFAALFERWRRDDGGAAPGGVAALPQCVLHAGSSAEVEAAVALLRCCYMGTFDGPAAASRAAADAAFAAPRGAAEAGLPAPQRNAGAPPPARPPPCWQQLAVRTLVLADRLGCAGVVDACVEALSGKLFAHQMSLDAALAVLWLLPETLARQEAVAPLQHMALVRVVQEFGELERALADPARAARLQQLPAEALAALLRSPELSVWGEGAALAALDVWASGPAGRVATAEQLASIGASVRLPLVPGPLLAAAAVLIPEAAFAEWPLEPLQRYYGASLDERYEMTHALLESGQSVPWSSVRRLRTADEALAEIQGSAHLSQLRRLYEATSSAAGSLTRAGRGGGAHAPSLRLGTASFGGLFWRAELVCCPVLPGEAGADAERGAGAPAEAEGGVLATGPATSAEAAAPHVWSAPGGAVQWRFGLRIAAGPQLGTADGGGGSPEAAGRPASSSQRSRQLLAIGAAKAAAALARHCRPCGSAAATAAPTHAANKPHSDGALDDCHTAGSAAFDLAVGVRAGVGETIEALAATAAATAALAGSGGSLLPLALREGCGGGAWCLRASGGALAAAAPCRLCRRGVLAAPLPRAPGEPARASPPVFVGWQPALWSALAPGGQLHWHCALRVLTDY